MSEPSHQGGVITQVIDELITLVEIADRQHEQAQDSNADFASGYWLAYSAALRYVIGNLQEIRDSGIDP